MLTCSSVLADEAEERMAPVPAYRLFLKESSGRIIGVHLRNCGGDDEIPALAKGLLDGASTRIRAIEAWDGPRHVLEVTREEQS